eukprot:Phypoly_transcript_12940.p1 GENE.Phypoly_transcript_12940~~Phypoly_transcript_12940.p1  ORF type:complete len:350 (+),score=71.72 Phypoly_transcript_12940:54-1052(+)
MTLKHYFLVLLCTFLVLPTHAHMYLSSLTVGGTALNEGDCVRLVGSNSPVMPVTSADMTCGFKPNADKAANRKCPVAAGSKVGMQWYHESPSPSDDIVDPSHRGPCTVYMAEDKNDGNPKWFKIYENGYDTTTQKFCVDTLIANRGYLEFTIPSDIAPGNYLLRGETIALHESYRTDGAQFYIGCAEITVSGNGKASPSTVSLPGAYKNTDPGLYIPNFYSAPITQYTVPGPAVYVAGSSKSGANGAKNGDNAQNGTKKGGMSPGGVAALVIFLLAFVGAIAFGAFYYHKHGHILGFTIPSSSSSSSSRSSSPSSHPTDRRQANYVAFEEEQ